MFSLHFILLIKIQRASIGVKMLTGYWTIDVFIIANLLLWGIVAIIFGYQHIRGGGMINDQSQNNDKRGLL